MEEIFVNSNTFLFPENIQEKGDWTLLSLRFDAYNIHDDKGIEMYVAWNGMS